MIHASHNLLCDYVLSKDLFLHLLQIVTNKDILIHGSRDILHKNQIRNKQFEVNL